MADLDLLEWVRSQMFLLITDALEVMADCRPEGIRNAVKSIKKAGGEAITLSGFGEDNPLRSMGDLNIWLDSTSYGLVEIGHLFYLHYLFGLLQ